MIDAVRVVCVLVAAAATWTGGQAVGGSSSSGQARNSYVKLFEHSEPVEDWKLMQSLLVMRETRFQGVDYSQLDSARFWYDAVAHFRPNHCNRDHWDELTAKWYQDTNSSNGGLLQIARKALIDFCSGYFIDIDNLLWPYVEGSLDSVKSIYNKFDYWYSEGGADDWRLVSLAREVAGAGVLSKQKFDQAWGQGFCARILGKLREPGVSDYGRFAQLVTQAGPAYFKYCAEPVRFWVKIVYMCQHLENAEQSYVNGSRRASPRASP